MMPQLPGLAMINAIRDTIRGFCLRGCSGGGSHFDLCIPCHWVRGRYVLCLSVSLGDLGVRDEEQEEGSRMAKILLGIIFCFCATWCFAGIMHAPRRALFPSSVNAAAGYLVFTLLVRLGEPRLGYFFGTLVIAVLGEYCARRIKMPSNIFIFPGVIPIVPGFDLYQTLSAFVQNNYIDAMEIGANAITNIGAMSIAIALVGIFSSKRK